MNQGSRTAQTLGGAGVQQSQGSFGRREVDDDLGLGQVLRLPFVEAGADRQAGLVEDAGDRLAHAAMGAVDGETCLSDGHGEPFEPLPSSFLGDGKGSIWSHCVQVNKLMFLGPGAPAPGLRIYRRRWTCRYGRRRSRGRHIRRSFADGHEANKPGRGHRPGCQRRKFSGTSSAVQPWPCRRTGR